MAKTEKQILDLKQEALNIRDTIIQAKATMKEITNNIKNAEDELRSLGVEPDSVNETIQKIEAEIDDLYNSALEKIQKWNKEQLN